MIVEKKMLNRWKVKRESGDQKKISEFTQISENAISRAFSGRASKETIEAIEEYFSKK